MLDHERMAGGFLSPSFLGQVGLLQSSATAGETRVITVAVLAQSPVWISCP